MVTRVPITTIVWSPNLKAAMSDQEAQKKSKSTIERRELILSFVQDKQKYGEFFLSIESLPDEKKEDEISDLMTSKSKPPPEKKLIPALDIKSVETVDALTFSIILHDDCLLNCYDIVDPAKAPKKNYRTSSLISAFGSIMTGSSSQHSDGGFPMAFESEHVTQIIQCFQKLHSKAYSRQQDLNQKWE